MKIKANIKELLEKGLNFQIYRNTIDSGEEIYKFCFFKDNELCIHKHDANDEVSPSIFRYYEFAIYSFSNCSYDEIVKIFDIHSEYEFEVKLQTPQTQVDNKTNVLNLENCTHVVIYDGVLMNKSDLNKFENIDLEKLIVFEDSFRNKLIRKLVKKGKIKDEKIIDFVNSIYVPKRKNIDKTKKCDEICKTDKKKKYKNKKGKGKNKKKHTTEPNGLVYDNIQNMYVAMTESEE